MLHTTVELLDGHGPDALQTQKVVGAAGTSTTAVHTHFSGYAHVSPRRACGSSTPPFLVPQTNRPSYRSVRHRLCVPPLCQRATA
ncbi:TetR family transcriptional regulator [Mycobacterium uberis]|uniref:TetR family transcriptional regulator n=1 Tax=Mycobacterium uberis TaxID=2162698 RepID=UPI001FB21279|nr:TetR family transcriptional regulator [Mycobacterium uberis]